MKRVELYEGGAVTPVKGSAGLRTQLPGSMTSVSNIASATGGIQSGTLIKSDIG